MARSWFRRFCTEDLVAKGFAVVGAFALWMAVNLLGTQTLVADSVAVGVSNLRNDLAVATPLKPVQVKLRVPRSLLQHREPKDLVRVFLDLGGRGLGQQNAELTAVPTDPRVEVVIVLPSRVDILLEPVIQRSLPARVVTEGRSAEGFKVGEVSVDPKEIEVRGALSVLQSIPAVEVPVSVEGAQAAMETSVAPRMPSGLTSLTEQVRATVDIVQTEDVKTLGVRVTTRGTPAAGYWIRSVTTDPPVVTVRGTREVLHERMFVETTAVDVDELRESVEWVVDVVVPTGVTVVGGNPKVRVRVEVAPLEGTKEVAAAVRVENLPDGLRVASLSPASIRVTVRGSGEAFTRLGGEGVHVALSLADRSAGTFTMRPLSENVRVPSGVVVVSIEGVDITVTLEGS